MRDKNATIWAANNRRQPATVLSDSLWRSILLGLRLRGSAVALSMIALKLQYRRRAVALLFLLLFPGLVSLLPAPLSQTLNWLGDRQAHAAISFVQGIGQTAVVSNSATTVVNVTSNVTAGNSIIVTIAVNYGLGGALSCSDSQGNSYTVDLDVNDFTIRSATCAAHNVTALTTSDTITINHPTVSERAASAHEFSGLSAASTLDRTSSANGFFNGFFGQPNSGNTPTTIQADELLIGNIGVSGPISDGFTPGAGYTALARAGTSSFIIDVTVNPEYRIVSSTGAYLSNGTITGFRGWNALITTYREAAVATITISGTCQQVDQTTNCSDTGTIRVAVNGVLQAQTQTTVAGTWTISGVTAPASGDVITVFIDGALNVREAVAVSKYDGTGNIMGIELIENHLTIGSDDNQTLTNADLSQYDNSVSGDGDVFHDVSALNDLTVDITGSLAVEELYIKSGNIFRPDSSGSGNVTTHDLEINGTLIADSNSVNLNGSWDNNAVFTAGTSSVNFTAGSGTETVDSSGAITPDFYNISFNDAGGTATYQLESILNVSNDLTVTDGILDTRNGSDYAINVGNDFLQPGGQVQARSSTLTVARHFTADGSETSAGYNSASLVMNGTASFTYNTLGNYWENGFFNITLGQSGNTTTLLDSMAVRNQIIVGSGTLGGAVNLYLRGVPNPLVVDANANIEINQLRFFGTTQQNLPTLINGYDASIKLARSGTILTQTGVVTINSGSSLILDGDTLGSRIVTYNTNDFDLIVGGNLQIGTGGDTGLKTLNGTNSNITVGGDFDIRSGTTTFTSTNSTVTLNGMTDQTITSNGSSFNHLILNNTGPASQDDIIIVDALDINGDLTITTGWLDLGTNNPAINTAGNVTIQTNGFVWVGTRTADWTFDGTSLLSDASSGGLQDLQDVVVNGSSLTLASDIQVETMTVTTGTLNLGAAGYVLEIDGTGTPLSSSATFVAGTSTVNYTGSGSATNVATLPYSSLQFSPTSATTYSLTGDLTGGNAMTGSLTVGANATLETTAVNNYNITMSGNYDQSSTTSQVEANASTITVGGNFTVDGSIDRTNYNSVTLVMDGVGLLTYNNLSSPWDHGFNNITVGQGGNITTVANLNFTVLGVLTIGSGSLNGSGSESDIFLKGGLNSFSVNANSIININTLYFHGNTLQNIPPLLNGYDSHIRLSRQNANVIQTGAVTINAGNSLWVDGDGFASRPVAYNTAGFDLNVTGDIYVGAGDDTALKTFDGTNSNITIGGDFNIFDVGIGTQQALFIATNSTVTLNGTNQSINGSTTFYNLTKSVSSAATLTFSANSTQVIASGGTVTLAGVSGQLLTLNCSGCTPDVDHWNLNISSGAFKSIDYVNVSDADASGSDASHKPINPANYNNGGSTISWFGNAVITVMKMSLVITDPVNGSSSPKRIPGAVIEYSVVPSNSGVGSPDANTVVITDAIDAASVAFDTTTGVSFTDGTTSSGLAMGTVTYSNTPAPGPYVYGYTPSAGYDGAVTSIRVTTTGTFGYGGSPDPSFTLRYRVLIK